MSGTSLNIWSNRVNKEFRLISENIPQGVSLVKREVDFENGSCAAIFSCTIPNKRISENKVEEKENLLDEKNKDTFIIEFNLNANTKYPFNPPIIRVIEGEKFIPRRILDGNFIKIYDADQWSPLQTTISILANLMQLVRDYDPNDDNNDDDDNIQLYLPHSIVDKAKLNGRMFTCSNSANDKRILNRLLYVSKRQILELESDKSRQDRAVVVNAHNMQDLVELKFKRGQSISLNFSDGTELLYLMPESFACVELIQEMMKQYGVEERRTSLRVIKNINKANELMTVVDDKIAEFYQSPNVMIVEEVMDLMREAAEHFSAGNDSRHQEVITRIHEFLQQSEVISLLENSVENHRKKKMENNNHHQKENNNNISQQNLLNFSFENQDINKQDLSMNSKDEMNTELLPEITSEKDFNSDNLNS